jgi:multidrug efflux pump
MMAPLIDAALSRTRTVLCALVLLLVAGLYTYIDIPKESEPDIDIPQIYISMSVEGISPEDSERLLLRPVEQEMTTIEGVKEISASAYQGGGYVLLEFKAGFDKDQAMLDVREAVDKVRPELPDSMDSEPSVTEVNFSLFPVLIVTLSGDVPERTLLQLARQLQDKVESLPSVLEAAVAGDREELVEIIISPELLDSYNLDGVQIIDFFNRSNRLVAAGNLDTGKGRFAIEVPGLFENVTDILNMPVRTNGDSTILLRDIAEIRRGFKDPENFARLNGERAIALEVVKRSGENIIDTIAAVRQIVETESKLWPPGVTVNYTQDRSEDIRTMLVDLQNNVISAVLLVMVVIVASLGLRTSLLVAVAVPGSFLAGILIIYVMGLTVNVVVLFALIMAVGMIVDGAIIVTEYADRKMVEGLHRREAYRMAAKRMAWPVISSISTTLAAFAPLMFWPGIVGEFMKYLPLTLMAVMGSSLVMALIFVPALGALVGKPGAASDAGNMKAMAAAEEGDLASLRGFTGMYVRVLDWVLARPGKIIIASVVMLVGVQFAYGKFGKGVEFFPYIEPQVASVLVHARGNMSVYQQDELVRQVEDRILELDGVKTVYTRSGGAAQMGANLSADVIGQIQLEFTAWDTRPKAAEITKEIIVRTADIAGIMVEVQEQESGPPGGKDIQIELASRFPELLPDALAKVRGLLEEKGGFTAIEDSSPLPGITWELKVDRAQAAKFGLDVTTIGYYLRLVTNGLQVTEFRPDDSDDEIDIVIRHETGQRTSDQLDRVMVQTAQGAVPVSNFIHREAVQSQGTISRSGQRRIMTVQADVEDGQLISDRVAELKKFFVENPQFIDPRIEVKFRGEDEDQIEAQNFLVKAFIVALFVMAIIMVTQFNSFYSAFLVLSAVIMSTIGVFLGLMITQQPFGIVMSGIGVISLAGIIVSNNIILIDTFDYMRQRYGERMSVREMILRTGAQRLRPVFLTVITTVLGLLPMVFMMNIDFVAREVTFGAPSTQWWVQLSMAVAFGLSFATVLTLLVTPAALMFRDSAARMRTRVTARLKRIIRRG